MKTLRLLLSLVTALAASPEAATQKPVAAPFEVALRMVSKVVRSDSKVELILTLNIKQATSLSATFLTGVDLRTAIDGKPGPRIFRPMPGKVKLAGGTTVERRIPIDIASFAPKPTAVTRVSFAWTGIEGVNTMLEIVPKLEKVSVDRLDLTKTRVLLVTSHGDMLLKFHPDKAPNTVRNFVKLAKDGFYDGTRFHRVVRGFMIQGGCPNTKVGSIAPPGAGGPGYTIEAEFNPTKHVKGVLSMAHAKSDDSGGCQFFIVHATSAELDGKFTAFGELVTGEDTLNRIAKVEVGGPSRWTPTEPVQLKAALVFPALKEN